MWASCKYLTRSETGDWRLSLDTGRMNITSVSHLLQHADNSLLLAYKQYSISNYKSTKLISIILWNCCELIVYLRKAKLRQTMEWLRYYSSRVKRFSQGNCARASHDTFHRIEEIGNWTISEANIMSSDGNVRKPGIYFSANIKIVIFLVRKIRELA